MEQLSSKSSETDEDDPQKQNRRNAVSLEDLRSKPGAKSMASDDTLIVKSLRMICSQCGTIYLRGESSSHECPKKDENQDDL